MNPPRYHNDKRWRDREERWALPADRFDPAAGFVVDVIPERDARSLVAQHHYAGASFPAARLCIGLIRKTGLAPARLCGAAVFSVPMQQQSIPHYTGLPANEGVELGRLVCTDEVGHSGESWFVARAFKLLRQEKGPRSVLTSDGYRMEAGVRAVLSYSDPLERTTASGELTKRAHAGTIYQALSGRLAGRSSPRNLWLTRDGLVLSERALTKIRTQDQGHAYAERAVVDAGGEPRLFGEDPSAWLKRVLVAPTFRRLRHPGNWSFLFALDRKAQAAIDRLHPTSAPYPKLTDRVAPPQQLAFAL